METTKCLDCDGTGGEWWIDYALKERPHDTLERRCSEQEAKDFCLDDWPDYAYGEVTHVPCDTCGDTGYVAKFLGKWLWGL